MYGSIGWWYTDLPPSSCGSRVSVSIPVVMISYRHHGGCICELGMPIREGNDFKTNNLEIAAGVAPNGQMLISVGTDATVCTSDVEYPFLLYIYGLYGQEDKIENAHFPEESHGYDVSKRAEAYPFLAKHLGLDISKVFDADDSLHEGGIVIEEIEDLYPFDARHPFPILQSERIMMSSGTDKSQPGKVLSWRLHKRP